MQFLLQQSDIDDETNQFEAPQSQQSCRQHASLATANSEMQQCRQGPLQHTEELQKPCSWLG
jgi:hypothetical protein